MEQFSNDGRSRRREYSSHLKVYLDGKQSIKPMQTPTGY
jgi:hypothetical protein